MLRCAGTMRYNGSKNTLQTHHLNFLSGSDFFFPAFLPPRPCALPRLSSFLNGINPFGFGSAVVMSASDDPGTGAMRGNRYFGTFFKCG